MAIIEYSHHDITSCLGADQVAKGFDYRSAVSNLTRGGHTLSAFVRGSRNAPYKVSISLYRHRGKFEVYGYCSCPVGFNCKHVAAVLLAALPGEAEAPAGGVRPQIITWLERFRTTLAPPAQAAKTSAPRRTHGLIYVIARPPLGGALEVRIHKVRLATDGSLRTIEDLWRNLDQALARPPSFVIEQDLPILRALRFARGEVYSTGFPLQGEEGAEILKRVLASGRAYVATGLGGLQVGTPSLLTAGAAREGGVRWVPNDKGLLSPTLESTPPATLYLTTTTPFWYFDALTGEAGPMELTHPAAAIQALLSLPPISVEEALVVTPVINELAPSLPPPLEVRADLPQIDVEPVPVLTLDTRPISGSTWREAATDYALDYARVSFRYGEHTLPGQTTTTLVQDAHGQLVRIQRRPEAEARWRQMLDHTPLESVPGDRVLARPPLPNNLLALPDIDLWPHFIAEQLPMLREQGWQIEISPNFRHHFIEADTLEGSLTASGEGWFDVEMGLVVGDRKVRLEPLLADLFERDGRWLSGDLETIDDQEYIELQAQDSNERLMILAARLKPVVRVLVDLFDTVGEGPLRISQWEAFRLDALEQTGRWQFHGDTALRDLATRLAAGPGVTLTAPPAGLRATLRGYQQQGLSWMQFLREHDLSGVLADDMGLGKTLQTLAHILTEKEAGRLDCPALVVLPTTLVHNWREEAARFAPDLRVLDLHGPTRQSRFEAIPQHDLVLTTYPLIWRDKDVLQAQPWHLLILDEAQNVKNDATQAAQTIRALNARHRLCLTGTPLENHLGELWSQFDFLLPGFLGSKKDFTRRFRTPIEKNQDALRRDLLARRVKPFMLRRRKEDVATELPPKTLIVQTVEIEGAQRDLYESVRLSMQKKVREAIAGRGLARSRIVVLDALLKLRQVCCDPRLLKQRVAGKVKQSAKLEMLMEMLPELISEGRRILLFSQFSGMLELISQALDAAAISYVTLTGETTDRATPVKRFNAGEVPLFLISLKAGGVGLNLTTADTVIHYDPWWNPAAENQATDRAHRIGQDKPVFVYKLITAGSVEEKIVAMQSRKADLAAAILSEDKTTTAKFSAEDLEGLFEPIPEAAAASAPARGGGGVNKLPSPPMM